MICCSWYLINIFLIYSIFDIGNTFLTLEFAFIYLTWLIGAQSEKLRRNQLHISRSPKKLPLLLLPFRLVSLPSPSTPLSVHIELIGLLVCSIDGKCSTKCISVCVLECVCVAAAEHAASVACVCVAYVACGMWCPTTQQMSTDDCANCLIGEHFWLCWRPFANLTPIHTRKHTHTPFRATYISVSVSRAATLTAYSKCFFFR